MSRTVAPAGGRVRVLDHDPLRERRAVRPRVGIMLQTGGFAGELTVRETAELWAALGSRRGDVTSDLERLDLAGKRDVAVEQLSGGEQRRLEVALAIHGDPEVLLLDEPTTGLDPESRRRAWEVVSELVSAGTTVLLTTHYLDEAEALADRVAIMRDGAIAVHGTLGEVAAGVASRISFQAPATPLPPELAARRVGGRIGEIVLETRSLQSDLARLLAWARRHGLRLDGLTATQASLQEVFLALGAS